MKAGSNTFLGLVWSSVEELFQSELRRRVPQQQSFISVLSSGEAGTMLGRLPDAWHMPKLEMSVAWQPEFSVLPLRPGNYLRMGGRYQPACRHRCS